ncbi:MAG: hypothetical protein P0119_11375 [Nitrospira sp.]|nr:hypothetical protein [Nitrospira sp.]
MNWFIRNFKWVMLMSGMVTLTMVQAAIAPQAGLRSTFGDSLEGPLAEIIVRNWGALIALVGAMLIYGAFRPHVRTLVLVVAGLSKIIFISLILIYGTQYLGKAGIAVVVDSVIVVLFITYLVVSGRADTADEQRAPPDGPRPAGSAFSRFARRR